MSVVLEVEDVDRVLRLTLTPSGPGAEPLLVLSLGSQLCRFWGDQGPGPQAAHRPDELPEVLSSQVKDSFHPLLSSNSEYKEVEVSLYVILMGTIIFKHSDREHIESCGAVC